MHPIFAHRWYGRCGQQIQAVFKGPSNINSWGQPSGLTLNKSGARGSPRESAFERVSERTSEKDGFRAFQSFSEVFRGFQRFSEVFRWFFQRPSQRPSQSAIFL